MAKSMPASSSSSDKPSTAKVSAAKQADKAKATVKKRKRDIEKAYSTAEFVAKLRRFADALETGKPFAIQIAGERVRVPLSAIVNIEHERGDGEEEIEFQIKWPV